MTLVLPNAGEAAMLDAALKTASPEALTLKLYSNNYDAVETSVAGSFTECTGSGYAAKSLTRAGWNAAVTASSGTITCTVAASAKTFTRSTGSFITDGNHRFDDPERPVPWQGFSSKGPTTIGDNVWAGANVVITSGVTVGERCVIGANSVVTSDLPPFSIAAGAPAKVLRTIAYG